MTDTANTPETKRAWPPRGELDALLHPAIQAHDLDTVLLAVRAYAERTPPPGRRLYRPQPGLDSNALAEPLAEQLAPEYNTSWFHMLLYNAGNACLRAGATQLALEVYKQALMGFLHPGVYVNISAIMDLQGRRQEAMRWLKRAIDVDPNYSQAYLNAAALATMYEFPGEDPVAYLEQYREMGGTTEEALVFLQACDDSERPTLEAVFRRTIPL